MDPEKKAVPAVRLERHPERIHQLFMGVHDRDRRIDLLPGGVRVDCHGKTLQGRPDRQPRLTVETIPDPLVIEQDSADLRNWNRHHLFPSSVLT
jgi:hypothetical protein